MNQWKQSPEVEAWFREQETWKRGDLNIRRRNNQVRKRAEKPLPPIVPGYQAALKREEGIVPRMRCDDVEWRRMMPGSIRFSSRTYYSLPELARRRGWTYPQAYGWARYRLDQCVRVTLKNDLSRPHIYCLDEAPHRFPVTIEQEGRTYLSMRSLATARGVSIASAQSWARRHLHLCIRRGRYIYARNEEWAPKRISTCVVKDGLRYYSIGELARRRQIEYTPARLWALRHAHLTLRDGGHLYCRDEEWKSRNPSYAPPAKAGPTPEQLKAIMGRRRK